MLFPIANRIWNGVDIEGQRIVLRLQPHADGAISVMVIGLPVLTGFDSPCRVSNDAFPYFALNEITVRDTHLECLAAKEYAPMLREGFTLELEPGMAQLLRTWLEMLATVAAAAKAIADIFSAQLQAPIYHMLDAITSVVARIVLDGWDIEHSVTYERSHGTWFREQAFMSQFDSESARQELANCQQRSHRSVIMTPNLAQQQRFLLSPDGMEADWIHPLDPANPRHADWTDCTDLSDEAFQRLVCERQAQPRIVSLAINKPAGSTSLPSSTTAPPHYHNQGEPEMSVETNAAPAAAPAAASPQSPAKTILTPAAAWPFPTRAELKPLFVAVPETTLPNGTVVPAFEVGQYFCAQGADGKVVISATAKPWVEIDYAAARQACTDAGYALLTELQALAIAYNISQQDANWTGGKVGEGKLLQGLHLDPDDADSAYAGDYVSPDSAERRMFVLSNGQTICDAAGNVYSWIFDDVQGDESGLVARAFAADSPSITTAPFPSMQRGVGWYPKAGDDWSGRALVRGGCWCSDVGAGVFRLVYVWPDYADDLAGFRCTKPVGL